MFRYQLFHDFYQNSWTAQCYIQKTFCVFRVVRGLMFSSEIFFNHWPHWIHWICLILIPSRLHDNAWVVIYTDWIKVSKKLSLKNVFSRGLILLILVIHKAKVLNFIFSSVVWPYLSKVHGIMASYATKEGCLWKIFLSTMIFPVIRLNLKIVLTSSRPVETTSSIWNGLTVFIATIAGIKNTGSEQNICTYAHVANHPTRWQLIPWCMQQRNH